ncbi:MAG TPA: hypothetical protein VHQ65_07620 [Thermoanaerobaculia bacterium]|nr:hypothetical protein [Thermoanaerobaculia bacterium]
MAPEVHRRPSRLAPLLDDLRTYSLFAAAKVLLVVDTALVADSSAAADLVDEAAEALPLSGDPGAREREAASRLLQALRLFGIEAVTADPGEVVEALPDWVLQGGAAFRRRRTGRGRTKNQVAELREGLAALLTLARELELTGFAEGELAQLAALADGGLPEGHALVLAERSADAKHPVVVALEKRGLVERVGELSEQRGGGWQGLDLLADELERQTGVAIERGALDELARRTLRGNDDRASNAADPDSAARFAGEYRKLASLAPTGRITRQLVGDAVEDRGEEDVWKLLDAIGEGRGGEALERLGRMLAAASDPQAERLTFFALLAGFCRQLAAVRGMMAVAGVAAGESFYPKFKERLAPRLQAPLPDGRKNPLAGLHPYRLHRAYLAASRLAPERAARLPWRVLETELMLKGESSEPDTALSSLVAELAGGAAPAGPDRRGGGERSATRRREPPGRPGNRRRAR